MKLTNPTRGQYHHPAENPSTRLDPERSVDVSPIDVNRSWSILRKVLDIRWIFPAILSTLFADEQRGEVSDHDPGATIWENSLKSLLLRSVLEGDEGCGEISLLKK